MKPIPLHSPWRKRKDIVIMGALLVVASVLIAEPKTIIGIAITLATVPFLLLAFLKIRVRWQARFGGSKFMTIAFFFIALAAALALLHIVEVLQPYIGEHFA
jgi:phosphotransferase system  glucose/maltose/N-acetylglucosamine-specific IIC component